MNSPYVEKASDNQSENVVWHLHAVSKAERVALKPHKPCVLWFTGLSGSGKSTIANAVESKLQQMGCHTYLLDGDNVRHGLNGDLGFSEADRVENIRRIAEVAKLFADAGIITLTAFISPFIADRQMVRELLPDGEFIEVFIDTPLEICEQRDPKGLYSKARRGEIKQFTGIDSPYEAPANPEIIVKTDELDIAQSADNIVTWLEDHGVINFDKRVEIDQMLLQQVVDIARYAGDQIMAIYQRDFSVYEKQDQSPLTEADLAAHRVIVDGLEALDSHYPILSEESANIDWQERSKWGVYWLVDPLDGTKEFIKKNGEFTVNIALIVNGEPVLGVVYAPAIDVLYYSGKGLGAFKQTATEAPVAIHTKPHQQGDSWKVVGSRSHASPDMQAYLTQLNGEVELVPMGSSLKLCLVAEGAAHLYPRLGPTSEWDTAAAHAVVLEAGGTVKDLDGNALKYNQKESLLNPYFIVS